ncbi:MAG: universal stress protein [Dehalococcoidia bacterium]|nr:universal stress protein [Dehalococcoidia bacterium]
MFEKVLVCLDGSRLAEQILPYAVEEALHFKSKVILLKVMTVPRSVTVSSAAGLPVQTGDIIEEEINREQREANQYLESVGKQLKEKGLEVEIVVLQPAPVGDAIVRYAKENHVDLICIATRGHSGLGRVIFGSVADYVLKGSGLPILVIKPEDSK